MLPDRPAQGAGGALLDPVKALRPEGFALWVFETNTRATDSTAATGWSSSRAPTAAATRRVSPTSGWPGSADPLAYLRGRIDAVDADLAELVARRVALPPPSRATSRSPVTPAVTRTVRPTSPPEWPRHVPGLGKERIAAVMHTVIAQSLAAWEDRNRPRA